MESRLALDKECDVPFSLIDASPFNPKQPIQGVYRRGLQESLRYFGLRDRLKVWPDPHRKGRYIILDGNQRRDVIEEHLLNIKIKAHFKLADDCPDAVFNRVKEDDANKNAIDKLRKSLATFQVPCQVITKLDDETTLTPADAKLFALTFNRNHSKFDEVKQADVYREIRAEQISKLSEDSRKAFEQRLKAMVRPELPVVDPKPERANNGTDEPVFAFAEPGTFKPTTDEPWGPVPPASSSSNSSQAIAPQFVPAVFSFTKEGYEAIFSSVLRSKSRIFRENTLKRALTKLEQITNLSTLDDDIDSIIVETALLLIDKRIEALEQVQVKESEELDESSES
jgi:hypothetical protein